MKKPLFSARRYTIVPSTVTDCTLLGRTIAAFAIAAGLAAAQEPTAEKTVSFSRDIHPIISEKCFTCHGNDPKSRKGKLRLDVAKYAFAKRGKNGEDPPTIIKGDPENSEFFYRITTDDEDDIMPTKKSKMALSKEEIALLKTWIEEGADYELHWSFTAPDRPAPPKVSDAKWIKNPIDKFILAKLDAAKLKPNPPADRNTLIRRATFDLIGLPPAPDAVTAFVKDPAPLDKALAKAIDQLFRSKHYGEHRARYWLDAARYGDTHGLHLDNYREIWPYRDWVINAFNSNMPFDRFTTEQLAGDLLPNPTLDQRIATGFVRCNVTTSEGGAIDEEYLAIYAQDRVATTTKVWMGLNADCAACHDHKFDPLTMKDFYQLTAFFRNSTQRAMDGNAKDTPPNVFVPAVEDRDRYSALEKEKATSEKQLADREKAAQPAFVAWQEDFKHEQKPVDPAELALHVPAAEGKGKALKSVSGESFPIVDEAKWIDGFFGKAIQFAGNSYIELGDVGNYERDQKFSYGAWLRSPGKANGAAIARMDRDDGHRGWDLWLQNDRVGVHLIYTWPQNFIKVVTKKALKKNEWTHVFVTYDGSSKAAGVKIYFNGVPQEVQVEGDGLTDTIVTTTSLKLGRRNTGQGFKNGGLHDFRLYGRELTREEVTRLAKSEIIRDLISIAPGKRTPKQDETLLRHYLEQADEPYRKLKSQIAKLEKERAEIRKRGATTLVMQEKPDKPFAHILHRGEYDQPQEKVYPGTPVSLNPMPKDAPKNRLGLAKWLTDPNHPLTARVTVNRIWQEIFGTGIVETAEDFGTMGQPPSHPELLDWLAVEFRESGWDIQHILRLILSSNAYQQNSDSTAEKLKADPGNRLLSRGPRFRLDAEMIRDQALAASGLLVPEIGGPSVKPYQPPGVWFAVGYTKSNTARFEPDTGKKLYRRSLYTFWKRTAPPPSMEVFNAPSRESCAVRRERTNTPLQALTLMNDPQFIEAARNLATNAIKACGDNTRARLNHITSRVLARSFDDAECGLIQDSLAAFQKAYQADPEAAAKLLSIGESSLDKTLPAPELAALTMVASQILNFDEAITKR